MLTCKKKREMLHVDRYLEGDHATARTILLQVLTEFLFNMFNRCYSGNSCYSLNYYWVKTNRMGQCSS
jgi:hypothetical protein